MATAPVKAFKNILLYSTFALPLSDGANWQVVKVSDLPANRVQFSETLQITVNKSASPLVYKFKSPLKISSISLKGTMRGKLKLKKDLVQGQPGNDDFSMRVGFVLKGNKTLNTFQKMITDDYIQFIYSLAPKGAGIENVLFLNAYTDSRIKNTERIHPSIDIFQEKMFWSMPNEGSFSHRYKFQNPIETSALILSVDGDDTQSYYNLEIKEFLIEVVDPPKPEDNG